MIEMENMKWKKRLSAENNQYTVEISVYLNVFLRRLSQALVFTRNESAFMLVYDS